jgi:hypothetical protein
VGSVSVQSWSIACLAVIQLVSDAVVAAMALVVSARVRTGAGKKEGMKMPSEKATPVKEGKPSSAEKKEL